MRIAFFADVHVANHRKFGGDVVAGINRRGQAVLDTLSRAVAIARAEHCSRHVILGDLWDTTRPGPQLITAVQRILDPNTIPMLGNHDIVSDHPDDHALGPIRPVVRDLVQAPQRIRLDGRGHPTVDLLMIPYRPGVAEETIPVDVATATAGHLPDAQRILCLHTGLAAEGTPGFLRGAHDQISVGLLEELMDQYDIDAAISGNWHERREWYWPDVGRSALQVGTLCPTGWDNPGLDLYGWMAMWDTDTRRFASVQVDGPRFLALGPDLEYADKAASGRFPSFGAFAGFLSDYLAEHPGVSFYVHWTVRPGELRAANRDLQELRADGLIADGGAYASKTEQQVQARAAASAAASETTVVQALDAYLATYPVPDGVDRARVGARTRGYLKVSHGSNQPA